MQLAHRFEIIKTLGQGAGGAVYLVRDAFAPERPLALKTIRGDENLVAALRREFQVLAALSDPRLAQVYDFGTMVADYPGEPATFFTREYLDGHPLRAAEHATDLESLVGVAVEVCRALAPLHRSGLVHGDLKPDNIIVDSVGVVRLIDFGLVCSEGEALPWPAGTLPYVAPEVLKGRASDSRSDLYALGIILYELVVGTPPFTGSVNEVTSGHLHRSVPSLFQQSWRLELEPAERRALAEVIERLLAKEPDKRYPGVGEVEAVLTALASDGQRPSLEPGPDTVVAGLVARQVALAQIETSFLKDGRRGPSDVPVVLLRGGAGGGKTTILREFKWRAQLAGVQVVETSCAAAPLPWWPLPDLALRLELLAGQDLASRPSADDARQIADRAAAAALKIARREPLVVVVEDLQWATPEVIEALRSFVHEVASADDFLLVLSCCADGDELDLDRHLGEHRLVELPPLPLEDVALLVSATLGRRDDELAHELWRWTEGNPLFCMELLRRLRDRGGVASDGLAALGAPQRLEALWHERVADAPPASRLAVATVALLGHPVGAPLVAQVLEQELDDTQRLLDDAVQRGLLAQLPAGVVTLAQAGMRDVAASLVGGEEGQRIHQRLAAALEDRGAPEAERVHHLLLAGPEQRETAQVMALEVARRLLPRGADRMVAELLQEALAHWQGPGRREAESKLAEAWYGAGEYGAAATLLDELLTRLDDGEQRAAALRLRGRVAVALGDVDKAAQLWREALELVRAPAVRTRIRRDLGRMHLKQGHYPAAVEETEAALAEAEPTDPVGADLLCTLGLVADYRGAPDQALDCYTRALELARQSGARRREASVLTYLAIARQRQGDYGSAGEAYSKSLALARKTGDLGSMAMLHGNLGALAHLKGDHLGALEHYEAALRVAQRVGRLSTAMAARTNLGLLHLHIGEYERARLELESALAMAEKQGAQQTAAQAGAYLGELALRLGQPEVAVRRMAEARSRYEGLGQLREAAEVELDLVGALIERGQATDLVEAASVLASAQRTVTDQGWDNLAPRQTLAVARLAVARGDEERAVSRFDEAERMARGQADGEVEWQALVGGADLLRRRGAPLAARGKLQRAVELLEQVAAALPGEQRKAFWQDPRRRQARLLLDELTGHEHSSALSLPTGSTGDTGTAEVLFRLLEINKRINSDPELSTLLARIMDSAIELTGAERGFLLLVDDQGELAISTARDFDQNSPDDAHLQFSRSIAETVLVDGEPVITINAMDDRRFNDYLSVHQLKLQSVLCIPIRARGRVIGVLYMENRLRHGGFGEPDQRILLAFADQVAIALENARLMAELTRRQLELEQAKVEIEQLYEERGRQLHQRTAQLAEARRDLREAMDQIQGRVGFLGLVGQSAPMQRIFAILDRVRATDVSVVIAGESGTGKEMVARAIHNGGGRSKKPFVAINCGAIPETLLESELFGHVRGSFTGADRDKQGLLQSADGGTVFLDEIGDMPLKMQLDLLRVLQEKTVRPLGSARDLEIDVRVLAASNRPLRDLIQRGTFREDLYYRLSVVEVPLPPLRERLDDVPLLVDHFLNQLSARFQSTRKAITRDALRLLMAYSWPGNVRHLEHALTNAWVMCDGDTIGRADLTLEPVAQPDCVEPARQSQLPPTLQDAKEREKQEILSALQQTGWNRSQAAKLLGMPRRTLYRRLRDYGIQ
jgi:transcriptional regulator with GAF, ATPase, and Fis domain/Tfp pilus assembly protein PilF/predicted Ser/Thr protein kinase